jgi:Tfp pilus tip-associated adhesin PilY1
MWRKRTIFLVVIAAVLFSAPAVQADETAIFTNIAPDAMFAIDFSGSMGWNPPGNTAVSVYGDAICAGPFTTAGGSTDCKRLSIAKRSMFGLLDDNADGKIDCYDKKSLNIRIGYMGFRGPEDTANDPMAGNAMVKWPIGTDYHKMYCNANTGCGTGAYSCTTWNYGFGATLAMESAGGGTPLNWALREMKTYLDTHKAADTAKDCRQKFVILLSDGSDTYSCAGTGSDTQADMYKRRRLAVARAKALADAGYRVFVIGFGANMPLYLRNTLNWMAYYGGTDNPQQLNVGDTSAYDPTLNAECEVTATTGTCDGTSTNCYATSNDPGNIFLEGYAFISGNSTELSLALRQATEFIREANYSFSTASVASSRSQDENFIYEASFQPINAESFWLGHVRKFNIENDGTVGSVAWDAGTVLKNTTAASRTIKTLKAGALVSFDTTNMVPADLGVTTTTERDDIVLFTRGECPNPSNAATCYNKEGWKLGDIFRSAPVTVGTPSAYFKDSRDGANAFGAHRTGNARTSANGKRAIVAGANDGQLHTFRTSDGVELWSFIPPNLRAKLKNIAHKAHPTGLSHQYFVDGPVSVADVWLGTGDGTAKSASNWKTLLVVGEGRGSTSYLWSSSATCDSDFDNNYSAARPYYCGFWALDVTNTASPAYKWKITPTAAQSPYLGDPWSKMYIHRVKINGSEKWVGFMGAGHNLSNVTICAGDPTAGDCDKRGKGIFAIDLANGNVLWAITHLTEPNMEYSFPGSPALLDLDLDGLTDTIYMGDMGGSMWRIRMCTAADDNSCNTANWTVSRLFQPTGALAGRPIYTMPAAAKDASGELWVYWGTGDRVDISTAGGTTDNFFAVKESNNFTGTRTVADLQNISTEGQVYNDPAKSGWIIAMPGGGEKVLAEPTVFGGVVYFTSYIPPTGSDPCSQAGRSLLYGITYNTGGGTFDSAGAKVRSMVLGGGMATSPVVSFNPYTNQPDLYVTLSGGGGTGASTIRAPVTPGNFSNRTNILYWRDRRVQQ